MKIPPSFCAIGTAVFCFTAPVGEAVPVISEFMAENDTILQDEDGAYSDWIEIYNPDATAVNLAGYRLTDDAANLSKWIFPSVNLAAGDRIVVFASSKDRATAGAELHTNFQLSTRGEYLALVAPDGSTLLTSFSPVYPPQFDDVSFGLGIQGNVVETDITPVWVNGSNYTDIRLTSTSFTTSSSPNSFDNATGNASNAMYVWMDLSGALSSIPSGQSLLSAKMTMVGDVKEVVSSKDTVPANIGLFTVPDANKGADTIKTPSYTATSMIDYYAANTLIQSILTTPGVDALVDWEVKSLFQGWLDNPAAPQRGQLMLLNDAQPFWTRWGTSFNLNIKVKTTDAPSLDEIFGYMGAPTPGAFNSGSTPSGPIFVDFTEDPPQPTGGPLTISATLVPFDTSPVSTVKMFYRLGYGAEVEVSMTDTGNGVYTASIPASHFQPAQMTRWRFEATDATGDTAKEPPFRDPLTTSEYHGTVPVDLGIQSNLTVFHTFIPASNLNAVDQISGGRGSCYYLGQFYDNITMNRHGQSTGGFPKKSYNLDFPSGDRFLWSAEAPRVRDIDLLTNWADKSKVRHVLSYEIMRNSGVKAHFAFTVRVQRNGEFFSTADFVEDADEIYLKRAGLNPNGSLYKVYDSLLDKSQGNSTGGMEIKAGLDVDYSEVQEIVNGLDLTGTALRNYMYDNINLPMVVNMCAANCVVRNTDMHRKNWYLYRDVGDSNEWGMLPWDLDLAHGRRWNSTDTYFDNKIETDGVTEVGAAVRLIKYCFDESVFPEIDQMIYRRIRTLSDKFLAAPYFENRLAELSELIDPPSISPSDARLDFVKWGSWIQSSVTQVPYTSPHSDVEDMAEGIARWHSEYLPGRRNVIFNQTAKVPSAQLASPTINIGVVEFSPATGNQDEEYIELINPGSVAIDISDWKLSEAVSFTFESGTVIPGNKSLYVTPHRPTFRAKATRPSSGNSNFLVGDYSGHLSSFGETIRVLDSSGAEVTNFTYVGQPSLVQQYLIVSEIMYHPEPNGGAEYIELMNTHPTATLNLIGVKFTQGVDFDFTGAAVTTLAPGARVLVVREMAAFEEAHGAGLPVAGVFALSSSLRNAGETIKLEDADSGTVKTFTYNDKAPWPTAGDLGYSIVLVNPMTNPDPDVATSWRSSALLGGTPGGNDTVPFTGDPQADIDGNGQADLLDYALRSTSASVESVDVSGIVQDYAVVRIVRNIAAEDVNVAVEISTNLENWTAAGASAVALDTVNQGDGTAVVRYRSATPAGTEGQLYFRIRATLVP
jgi:hypothetical protein